jgi:hypothetical protein
MRLVKAAPFQIFVLIALVFMSFRAHAQTVYLTHERLTATVDSSTWTSLLKLELPPGSYLLDSSVLVHNINSLNRVPVLCALTSSAGSGPSETVGVQLESEFPQSQGRASSATVSVNFALDASQGTLVELQCISNTGPGGDRATATGRHLTALQVRRIVRQ